MHGGHRPPPPGSSRPGSVEAFGEALDAAVSRVDAALGETRPDNLGTGPRPSVPIFGEETPIPSQLPPSLGHIERPDEELQLAEAPRMELAAPIRVGQATQTSSAGAWILLAIALAVLGGVAFYLFGL